jgi:hypothetical protein
MFRLIGDITRAKVGVAMSEPIWIPDELRARIDRMRGDVPREQWVLMKLEQGMQLADLVPVDAAISTARRQRNKAQRRADLLEMQLRHATHVIAFLRAQLDNQQGE